jgi:hypothetical protein
MHFANRGGGDEKNRQQRIPTNLRIRFGRESRAGKNFA